MSSSLKGEPEKILPQMDEATQRSIQRQNETAQTLSKDYDVEQLPQVKGEKSPDYSINGEKYDCYSPETSNIRNIASTIGRKVSSGQADKIVVNLDDSPVTLEQMSKQLNDYPIDGLKDVIGVKNGTVSRIYP